MADSIGLEQDGFEEFQPLTHHSLRLVADVHTADTVQPNLDGPTMSTQAIVRRSRQIDVAVAVRVTRR